ncbi:hypothetical protein V5F34_07275 [Xanthobacter autotrophicus]|uniref:ABC transporter permease n=1 Tax=Xanthobacter autotrophicus TaxID=280 RepID=UPI00372642EC
MTPIPRPTRFAGESWRTASAMHARVVGAVIMRDLQTRFGTGYLGFLLGLMIPLGHLAIVIAIATITHRPTPLGTQGPVFLMTGILPFIIWLYSHRQIMMTIRQNQPLLYFPGVALFDLVLSRIIVEISTCTMVVLIVLSALWIIGFEINVYNWQGFIFSFLLAWTLGSATGLIFCIVGALFYPMIMAGALLGPLAWATSGIIFLPDDIPESFQSVLKYNPLLQIITQTRLSYFSEYSTNIFDIQILSTELILLITCGMILASLARRFI